MFSQFPSGELFPDADFEAASVERLHPAHTSVPNLLLVAEVSDCQTRYNNLFLAFDGVALSFDTVSHFLKLFLAHSLCTNTILLYSYCEYAFCYHVYVLGDYHQNRCPRLFVQNANDCVENVLRHG